MEDRSVPSAGALDPSFGTGGVVTTARASQQRANDIAVYPAGTSDAGKIVVGGQRHAPTSEWLLYRYNADGSLDTGFGRGGVVTTDFARNNLGESISALATLPDGKIVAGGSVASSTTNNNSSWVVARYHPNGSLDTSFGKNGSFKLDVSSSDDEVGDLLLQPDGKIVVVGWSSAQQSLAVIRLLSSGKLDTSFDHDGIVLMAGRNLSSAAIQSDGRLVVGGSVTGVQDPLQPDSAFWRFRADGSPDSTFGSGGRTVFSVAPNHQDSIQSLAVRPNGRILAVVNDRGPVGSHQAVTLQIEGAGTLDPAYGTGGIARTTIVRPDGREVETYVTSTGNNALSLQANGQPLVAVGGNCRVAAADGSEWDGYFSAVLRYTVADAADVSWADAGIAINDDVVTVGSSRSVHLALQDDGKVVTVGASTTDYHWDVALARYLPSSPTIGSFTASPNPVTAGSPVTLTAAKVTALNPNSTVTQVAFYRDSNGDGRLDPATDAPIGYGTNDGGTWAYTFATTGWAPGTYTLYAQAKDSYGVVGDALALTLTVL